MAIIRKTKSVEALLTLFNKAENAMSVVELVKQLEDEMNKTTVYRILDRLEESGHLHSFIGKDGLTWYAKCKDCDEAHHHDAHPHFQCLNCGKVECLSVDVSIPKIPNREVVVSHVLIQGKCESCVK